MDGRNLIGHQYSALADDILNSFSPAMQTVLQGDFPIATKAEIDHAFALATQATRQYRRVSGAAKAKFLRQIAEEIMALGDVLIERARQESALPEGRLKGERGRTVNQLRLFADLVEEGSWVEAVVDQAIPDRKPFPRADIRRMSVSIGPVVVFTASNFPLAFSTAGGDTASALAAGNPVIVKAHESHLGTNALVAAAIQQAAQKTGMPEGVFSSLNGTGPELGQALVRHPQAKAIAFTGSYRAGKAIFDSANQRPEPIPVFAEMGSINPVLLLPQALQERGTAVAQQYAQSVTLGVGQFCTNPGLLIAQDGPELTTFTQVLTESISAIAPATMLNQGICDNYQKNRQQLLDLAEVTLEANVALAEKGTGQATVASVTAATFLQQPSLQEEVFGPFTLLVKCKDQTEMTAVVEALQGQLTATVIADEGELQTRVDLLDALQERVGRVLLNGVPTGVEVCPAMHHGGPFPATSNARFTSVGTGAIQRFVRPLTFQNWSTDLLPPELQDANPLGIWRMVNGQWGKE